LEGLTNLPNYLSRAATVFRHAGRGKGYSRQKNYELDGRKGTIYRMGMVGENLAKRGESIGEDELEALIARFTLEYLYRWTNNFDPAALAEFKRLLDKAGPSVDLVRMLRLTGVLPQKYVA
jgi:hypothetical protein